MALRRRFSEEFKREAVGLTRLPGANVSQIVQNLGIGSNLLFRWRRKLDAPRKRAFVCVGVARGQEILVLERQLAQVTRKRDFFFHDDSSLIVRWTGP